MCNTANKKLCNTNAEALNQSINDSNVNNKKVLVIIILIVSQTQLFFSHKKIFNLPKVDYNNMPTSISV